MDNDGVVSKLGTSGLDTNKPGFKSCMDYWMSIARNYLGSKDRGINDIDNEMLKYLLKYLNWIRLFISSACSQKNL